jgi:hypothetical protein
MAISLAFKHLPPKEEERGEGRKGREKCEVRKGIPILVPLMVLVAVVLPIQELRTPTPGAKTSRMEP